MHARTHTHCDAHTHRDTHTHVYTHTHTHTHTHAHTYKRRRRQSPQKEQRQSLTTITERRRRYHRIKTVHFEVSEPWTNICPRRAQWGCLPSGSFAWFPWRPMYISLFFCLWLTGICLSVSFSLSLSLSLCLSLSLIGSGSLVLACWFPIVWLSSVTLRACCWISHVTFAYGLSLQVWLGCVVFTREKNFKCILTYDNVCSSWCVTERLTGH